MRPCAVTGLPACWPWERVCAAVRTPYTYRDFVTAYWLEANPAMLREMPWQT